MGKRIMIIAKKEHARDHLGIHPRLDRALTLLNDAEFLASVTAEPVKLEGDALYVFRCDYTTVPFEETFFESHRKYLDLQAVLSGQERADIADPAGLELFEQHDDFWGYHGQADQTVILRPDNFMVVFPGDAHRLKICADKPEAVAKVVFKILVNEEEN